MTASQVDAPSSVNVTGTDRKIDARLTHEVSPSVHCIPADPERDGYHWVRRYRGGPAIPLWWNATWHHNVDRGWGAWGQPDRDGDWEYICPCQSPDEDMTADSPDVHGWRAIETVPKDGTPVFLIIEGSIRLPWSDYWSLEEGFWIYYHQTQEYIDRQIEPTHWMPIPPVLS